VAHLDAQKRWWRVTVKDVEQAEFTHFSWIMPSEFVGDTVFARHGGFAYVNRRQTDTAAVPGVFYPVVSAEEERRHAEDERRRRARGESGKEVSGREGGGTERRTRVGGKDESGRGVSGGDAQVQGGRDCIPVIREREIDVTISLPPRKGEMRVQWAGGCVWVCGCVGAWVCVCASLSPRISLPLFTLCWHLPAGGPPHTGGRCRRRIARSHLLPNTAPPSSSLYRQP
jgi:hypothetical protein